MAITEIPTFVAKVPGVKIRGVGKSPEAAIRNFDEQFSSKHTLASGGLGGLNYARKTAGLVEVEQQNKK